MDLPEHVLRTAEADVARLCERRSPAHVAHLVRTEYHVRGTSVTICETRPPWRAEDPNPEWTHHGAAQLRYRHALWWLYWSDRNGKWHPYDLVPSAEVSPLLAEIDRDPTAIFWG